ncbi:hypothetical protein ROA7450_03329 [Roseovarius albus]|uniref:Uncharacterized protein n=2 Tax=Roseovarius albus TaxID=1247867 RepID=A0A1X6ZYG0_9RHOB|nr:hypothetical protein ROA7450_03329 [Roseovarius albus]
MMFPSALGVTARERPERFRLEAITEVVLRLAGVLLIVGAIMVQALLPDNATEQMVTSSRFLSLASVAVGLFIFAYGTRGFRHQLRLNIVQRTLELTRININDQGRISRTINIDDIESFYIVRPKVPNGVAKLYVRTQASGTPFFAIGGQLDEIERLHQEMCSSIAVAQKMGGMPPDPAKA